MTNDTEIRANEVIEKESCPFCQSENLNTFHDPFLPIAHTRCNVCGSYWAEETTSWAEQDTLKLSDERVAGGLQE